MPRSIPCSGDGLALPYRYQPASELSGAGSAHGLTVVAGRRIARHETIGTGKVLPLSRIGALEHLLMRIPPPSSATASWDIVESSASFVRVGSAANVVLVLRAPARNQLFADLVALYDSCYLLSSLFASYTEHL